MTSTDAPPGLPVLHTLAEVADITRTSVDTIEREIAAGNLGFVTIGGGPQRVHRRITDAQIADWITARTVPATVPTPARSVRSAVAKSRRGAA